MRVKHIVVLHDAGAESSSSSQRPISEGTLRPLVEASVELQCVPRPLARIARAVADCPVAHVAVAEPLTVAEVLSKAPRAFSMSSWAFDEPRVIRTPNALEPGDPAESSANAARSHFRGAALDALVLEHGSLAVLQHEGTDARLHMLTARDAEIWSRADGVERSLLGGTDDEVGALLDGGLLDVVPSWRIADDVAWVDSADRTTVLGPTEDSFPLALAGSSHIVWGLLADQGAMRQEDLITDCVAIFGASAQEVSAPIDSLLHDLWSRGLIIRV